MSKSVFIVLLCILFLVIGFWLGRGKDDGPVSKPRGLSSKVSELETDSVVS